MLRTFEFRLYPTASQAAALSQTCRLLCDLYNACIQERRDAWRQQRVRVTNAMQSKQLPAVRKDDARYAAIFAQTMQNVVRRADQTFQAFFRRCKRGATAGFPRFKAYRQYGCFAFPQAGLGYGAVIVSGKKRLRIHGIGNVKIKLHREHEGALKQIRVLRRGDGHWYAQFVCENVPARPLPGTGVEVGLDVGIKSFAALSNEETVKNPRWYQRAEKALSEAHGRLDARLVRSGRHGKQRQAVSRKYLKVTRQRRDFQHKLALRLVKENDLIAVENLNVKGLAQGRLSKQIYDAGWSQFIDILTYKAESAGRVVVKVNPRWTSQTCSSCGEMVPKDLSVRVHRCVSCGYTADRDVNAAKNILRLGQSLREARRPLAA